METFHYYNMFETKGIEYLLTIAFFVLLIPFWLILNKRVAIAKGIQYALGVLSMGRMNIPQGIFYSPQHTWTYLRKSGIARVGIDDLILRITGQISIRELKTTGDKVQKGEQLAEIAQEGKLLKVFSPISGTLVSVNGQSGEHQQNLLEDPYGKGWLFEIKPSNWKQETQAYYLAEEAVNWTSAELVRFKDFLAGSLEKHEGMPSMMALQDGGELREHLLSDLPKGVWDDFQQQFMSEKQ